MDNTVMIHRKLTGSIFEVFEKMFYIFLEPAEQEAGVGAGTYRWRSAISFSGAVQGEMAALFSQPLAELMVRNMLNDEGDQVADDLLSDCLKEAINMICGNFLQKVNPAMVFDLSLPSVASLTAGEPLGGPVAWRLNFTAGAGEWLELIMRTRDNPGREADQAL